MIFASEDPVLLFGLYPYLVLGTEWRSLALRILFYYLAFILTYFLELSDDPCLWGSCFIIWPSSLVLGTEQWSLALKILFCLAFVLISLTPLKFDVCFTWNCLSCSLVVLLTEGSVADWGADNLNWVSFGEWDGYCFSISNRKYHFEMLGECAQDLRLVVPLKFQVLWCVNVVLIGTWLSLFGQNCGSCTALKIDTVSCSGM